MKALFWILLVANLLLFTVMRWGSDWWSGDTAVVAQPALNEAKIRLLNEPAVSAPVIPPVSSPASISGLATSLSNPTEKTVPVCMEWSDFSGIDLKRASEALATLSLGGNYRCDPSSTTSVIGYTSRR